MKLPILAYHNVLPNNRIAQIPCKKFVLEDVSFDRQMNYLIENRYESISFSDIREHLDTDRCLSSRSVIITFDDGCTDNYEVSFPLLRKYGLRATFFITTDSVGKKNYMTWDQIREMSSMGMEIQSHTHTHRDLNELSNDEVQLELILSKKILEERIDKKVDVIALPYGRGSTHRVTEIALDSGYRFACNSTWGANIISKGTICFHRFTIHIDCSMEQYEAFIELRRMPLVYQKIKEFPAQVAKGVLGRAAYGKFRNMILRR